MILPLLFTEPTGIQLAHERGNVISLKLAEPNMRLVIGKGGKVITGLRCMAERIGVDLQLYNHPHEVSTVAPPGATALPLVLGEWLDEGFGGSAKMYAGDKPGIWMVRLPRAKWSLEIATAIDDWAYHSAKCQDHRMKVVVSPQN